MAPGDLISFPVCQASRTRAFQASGSQRLRHRRVGEGYRSKSDWGLDYEAEELELNLVDSGSHGRLLDRGAVHSQGEELAVGQPGLLIQVWGVTWLRK